jgi:hypothetical protein
MSGSIRCRAGSSERDPVPGIGSYRKRPCEISSHPLGGESVWSPFRKHLIFEHRQTGAAGILALGSEVRLPLAANMQLDYPSTGASEWEDARKM